MKCFGILGGVVEEALYPQNSNLNRKEVPGNKKNQVFRVSKLPPILKEIKKTIKQQGLGKRCFSAGQVEPQGFHIISTMPNSIQTTRMIATSQSCVFQSSKNGSPNTLESTRCNEALLHMCRSTFRVLGYRISHDSMP